MTRFDSAGLRLRVEMLRAENPSNGNAFTFLWGGRGDDLQVIDLVVLLPLHRSDFVVF